MRFAASYLNNKRLRKRGYQLRRPARRLVANSQAPVGALPPRKDLALARNAGRVLCSASNHARRLVLKRFHKGGLPLVAVVAMAKVAVLALPPREDLPVARNAEGVVRAAGNVSYAELGRRKRAHGARHRKHTTGKAAEERAPVA